MLSGQTDSYHAFKSFPFLVFHAIFGSQVSHGDSYDDVYWEFILFNLACLAAAAILIAMTLRKQQLGDYVPHAIIMFFGTKAFLAFYLHYPLLGDQFAVLLGALIMYGLFSNRRIVVVLATMISAGTSPVLSFFALATLAWPKLEDKDSPGRTGISQFRSVGSLAVAILLVLIPVSGGLMALFVFPSETVQIAEKWGNVKYMTSPGTLSVATIVAACVCWFSARPVRHFSARKIMRAFSRAYFSLGCIVLGFTWLLIYLSLGSSASSNEMPGLFGAILIKWSYMLSHPGPPGLLSIAGFLGLPAAIIIVNWRKFSSWLSTGGFGLSFGFAATWIFFGLDGEIRHVLFLYPLIIVGSIAIAARRIRAFGVQNMLLSCGFISVLWIPFIGLSDQSGREPHLSSFGMCWNSSQYLLGLLMFALIVMFSRRYFLVGSEAVEII